MRPALVPPSPALRSGRHARIRVGAASLALLCAAAVLPHRTWAQPPKTISYTLRFPDPRRHYVEVEARVPAGRAPALDLMMPVWTPGSYLVREDARNVEGLAATSPEGRRLVVTRSQKNRWRIDTGGSAAAIVTYRVYCHEMGVRTNWVDADFASLNGAATFVTRPDRLSSPHDVQIELPAGWATSVTALPAASAGAHHYRARDYDTLVDSPILLGSPAVYRFEVGGKPHVLAIQGAPGTFDGPRAAADVEKIVRAAESLWGSLPYERYVFLNVLEEGGGGLEHRDSTLIMSSRWRVASRPGYRGWLGTMAHEYFHAWNVKRLRPIELGPFDYEREVYTTGLWVAEGFTDYYGPVLLRRAGLLTRDEYLGELSRDVEALQATPGRDVQSASAASFDAWIKQYRPDENSANASISYYTKGSVVAFLLDAKVRAATGGTRSLDDVMRLAMTRYGGARGYRADEFRAVASEVAGADLRPWFARAVDSTEELDYGDALAWFGLRLATPADQPPVPWLGLESRVDNGRLLVTRVRRGTPAYEAGLDAEDEILAIDDARVRPDQWNDRLRTFASGQKVGLLVARRDRLMRLDATIGTEPPRAWHLEVDPGATPVQHERLAAWIGE